MPRQCRHGFRPPLPDGLREGDFAGLPAWLIDTPLARAAISRFGGQLLSFAPAGHDELLWLSPALKPLPAPVRGGVPLCWPWFGREGGPPTARRMVMRAPRLGSWPRRHARKTTRWP
jgi:D-hexose-6-phosphate mutarotase